MIRVMVEWCLSVAVNGSKPSRMNPSRAREAGGGKSIKEAQLRVLHDVDASSHSIPSSMIPPVILAVARRTWYLSVPANKSKQRNPNQ